MNNTCCVPGFLECCFPEPVSTALFQPIVSPHIINCIHITFSSLSHSHLYYHSVLVHSPSLFPLLPLSHLSTLVVSDLVSWAVDGVLVSGCDVMVVAAALMELAKWISRGIQRALSLITDPSAKVKNLTLCPQNDWVLRILSIYLLAPLCFSVWTSQIVTLFSVKGAATSHPFIIESIHFLMQKSLYFLNNDAVKKIHKMNA